LLLNLKACSAGEIVRSSGGIVRSREPAQTHASERHRPAETPDALDRIASFEPHPQREIAAVDRSPGQGTGGRSVFRIDEVAREVEEQVWLVSFLDHDLGFLDTEKGRVEPGPNPFVRVRRSSTMHDKCRQIVGTSHRLGSLAKSGELLPTHPFLAGAHSD
jgi:hypothetical protein